MFAVHVSQFIPTFTHDNLTIKLHTIAMKKLSYLLLSLFILTIISCEEDSGFNLLREKELPDKMKTFLDTYFSEAEFESGESQTCCHGVNYVVKLDEAYVHFDDQQDWSSIEFTGAMTELASQLLHEDVLQQLQELEQKDSGYQVIRLENYYNQEVLIKTRNHNCYVDTKSHTGQVLAQIIDERHQPESVIEFINQFTPNSAAEIVPHQKKYPQNVKYSISEATFYRHRVAYDTYVDFEENGRMFYMQEEATAENNVIANYFIKALPEGVINRLISIDESIVSQIRSINIYHDMTADLNQLYGFTLKDKSFYLIDSNFEVVDISA